MYRQGKEEYKSRSGEIKSKICNQGLQTTIRHWLLRGISALARLKTVRLIRWLKIIEAFFK